MRRLRGEWNNDAELRLRLRILFMQGELLKQIEVFTSAEDMQIAHIAISGRFGVLCTTMRCVITTRRAVQTGDAYDMGAMPDALDSKLAC